MFTENVTNTFAPLNVSNKCIVAISGTFPAIIARIIACVQSLEQIPTKGLTEWFCAISCSDWNKKWKTAISFPLDKRADMISHRNAHRIGFYARTEVNSHRRAHGCADISTAIIGRSPL